MNKIENLTRVALLIDGDNISPDFIQKVLTKAKSFGTLVIKRVYADFTQPQHAVWKNTVLDNGLHAMHTFAFTKGKNTTDIALVIDAMDLMCAKKADVFCIASSDSDFAQLAVRLQENGIKVVGLGKFCTLPAFRNACSEFIYLDDVTPSQDETQPVLQTEVEPETPAQELPALQNLLEQDMSNDQETVKEVIPAYKAEVPQLPGLNVVGKIDLETLDSRTGKKLKPTNKVEDTLPPGEITFTKPVNIDGTFLSRFHEIFLQFAGNPNGTVLLSQLSETLRKANNFTPKQFGFINFRMFCESLHPYYEVVKHPDGCTCSLKKVK
ncbi:NYN domain-containing protein [Sphingobacteriales bacterium UPWRP_1]|nr:hypothetical protein BVG80_08535 [Sphingobacteriales bacterium TSM_CSM]PSJ78474.1 NYN domain-containing protein [Sphingobacteriales bacterium UPWRP_1]